MKLNLCPFSCWLLFKQNQVEAPDGRWARTARRSGQLRQFTADVRSGGQRLRLAVRSGGGRSVAGRAQLGRSGSRRRLNGPVLPAGGRCGRPAEAAALPAVRGQRAAAAGAVGQPDIDVVAAAEPPVSRRTEPAPRPVRQLGVGRPQLARRRFGHHVADVPRLGSRRLLVTSACHNFEHSKPVLLKQYRIKNHFVCFCLCFFFFVVVVWFFTRAKRCIMISSVPAFPIAVHTELTLRY